MWDAEHAVKALRARGDLWEVAPGLVGLRGDALELLRAIESEIDIVAGAEDAEEWLIPPAITSKAVLRPLAPSGGALVPAVCYHCYARHAGTTLAGRIAINAQQTMWRHDSARLAASDRGSSTVTMREIVVLGTPGQTSTFLARSRAATIRLARSLGIDVRLAEVEDPSFPLRRRADDLPQRAGGLEWQLLARVAKGRELAIASFNDHEKYFGQAFDISLPGGGYASTACVAYGLERWMVALLVARGPDAREWPRAVGPVEEMGANGFSRQSSVVSSQWCRGQAHH